MIVPQKSISYIVCQVLNSFDDVDLNTIEPFQCVEFILLKKKDVPFNIPTNLAWLNNYDENYNFIDGCLYSIVIQRITIDDESIFLANIAYEKPLNQDA